ncbi:hypothetical protein [Allohahella marinimesophila]|uniref:Uncharacterized protein n=1 Tax=Allohahella marinimesophila TaxID=1054972 RepID=A0ABP7PH20_9GAMM
MNQCIRKTGQSSVSSLPLIIGLVAFTPSIAVALETLCTRDEYVFWSCSAAGKVYSLCGQSAESPDTGYLQYRAGPATRPDIIYPASQTPATDNFRYQLLNRAAAVHFESAGFQHSIYESINAEASIDVEKDGKRLLSVRCDSSSNTLTLTSTINEFKAMGIYD